MWLKENPRHLPAMSNHPALPYGCPSLPKPALFRPSDPFHVYIPPRVVNPPQLTKAIETPKTQFCDGFMSYPNPCYVDDLSEGQCTEFGVLKIAAAARQT